MNGLTAADFADTGQWRLIVNIYPTGINAYLENTIHEGLEPQLLFSTEWDPDRDTLLHQVENAVYDHPRVLDDFSARIIVYDLNTMFMPTELVEETAGAEEDFYTAVYDVAPEDVMSDTDKDLTAAYSPAPGLNGFLRRTFPGAIVECNLMSQVRKWRRGGIGKRMKVTVRKGEADIILTDGESLLTASTHTWHSSEDIVYHVVNILDVYQLLPADTDITFSGEPAEYARECIESITGKVTILE